MRNTLLPLLFIVVTYLVGSDALAAGSRDGAWWKALSQADKSMYVIGFFDGQTYTSEVWDVALNLSEPKFDPERVRFQVKVSKLANKALNDDFGNVSVGQLASGLDTIYADFRNSRIPVIDAMTVVVRSMGGTSEADVQKLLERKRAEAVR
jgi:hypothetical protein